MDSSLLSPPPAVEGALAPGLLARLRSLWTALFGRTPALVAQKKRQRRLALDAPCVALLWLVVWATLSALALAHLWLGQTQAAQQSAQAALAAVDDRLDEVAHEIRFLSLQGIASGCGSETVQQLVQASLSSRWVRRYALREPDAPYACTTAGPASAQDWVQRPAYGLRLTTTGQIFARLMAVGPLNPAARAPQRSGPGQERADDTGARASSGPQPAWWVQAELDERIFEGAVGARQTSAVPLRALLLTQDGQSLAVLAHAEPVRGQAAQALPAERLASAPRLLSARAESSRFGVMVVVELLARDAIPVALWRVGWAGLAAAALTALLALALWRRAVNRARLVKRIELGLRRRQFEPHVQPIVDLSNGRCVGGEVLMRWHHPQRGVLAPFEFIEEAERTGLIVGMSDLVMVRAAQRLAPLAQQQPEMYFSFNVTPQQLVDPGFAQRLDEIFNADTLPRHQVLLELTEREFVDQRTSRALNALHDAGWRVAMDDFGTGQSSLASLEQLRIDRIKIDRAFVRTIDEHTVKRPVLDAIIHLAQQLNVRLIAEGVETQSQWDYLRERGVHYAQGYLFAKPLSIDDFARWLWQRAEPSDAADGSVPAAPTAALPSAGAPATAPALIDAQAQQIWQRMRMPGGLDVRSRMHGLRSYADCFVGTEAVDWLVRNQRLDRQQAVRLGQRLVAQGLMAHVVNEHDFKDQALFYRLCGGESTGAVQAAAQGLTQALRGPDGPRWRDHRRGLLSHGGCVRGRELVDWMAQRQNVPRNTALQWANQLMRQGVLRHVYDDQPVCDDHSLFRLG